MAADYLVQRKTFAIQVAWFVLLSVRLLSATEIRYIGCMMATSEAREEPKLELIEKPTNQERQRLEYLARKRGPFSHLVGEFSGMTVQVCVQRCWINRNEYAALQAAQHCFCANTVGGLAFVNTTRCYDRCSGNCLQRCGGAVALSVYSTGYEKEPPFPEAAIEKARQKHRFCLSTQPEPDPLCDKKYLRLYSPRMSPIICISYCSNQSSERATLKDAYTCCCADYIWRNFIYSISEKSEKCNLPCASGEPRCVGRIYDKLVSATFWVVQYYPWGEQPNFDKYADWLSPQWPANQTFEHEEYRPRYVSPAELEKRRQQEQSAVVDAPDTGVGVVDEPVAEEESSSTGIVIGVIACCVVLGVGIIGTIHHRKNKSPATFKLPDKIEQKIPADDEDTEEKKKSKKKKKKKKKKKRSKSKDEEKKSKKASKNKSENNPFLNRTDRIFIDSCSDASSFSDDSQTSFSSPTDRIFIDSYSDTSSFSDDSQTSFISRNEEFPIRRYYSYY